MNIYPGKSVYAAIIIVSLLTGFSVYFFLSFLYVESRVTIPLSIVMSVLIFGLTRYYSKPLIDDLELNEISFSKSQDGSLVVPAKRKVRAKSSIAFITIFVLLILVSAFSSTQDFHLFTNWNNFSLQQIIQVGAAIALCFFVPGFAIVLVMTKKYEIDPLLSILLAYLLSILITGLTAYVSALTFDVPTSDNKFLFTSVYTGIVVFFLVFYPEYKNNQFVNFLHKNNSNYYYIVTAVRKFNIDLKHRANEIIVFGSLLTLIIISTYYLYGGVTIGDQWYHQGRALLFMSGDFREATIAGADGYYPPFQSALLAALTVLSGVPIVNAYASIALVNMLSVFAYLYFFSNWVPSSMRKARILASSLFTLSAGFGWIYLLATKGHLSSVQSSLETLRDVGHLDIVSASNFVIPTAPDFSTGLIYIALPAGFTLLGILRAKMNAYTRVAAIASISVLGIMSHYEFYFFIIIACILPIIFKTREGNYTYLSFYFAFFIIFLIDMIAPGRYSSSLTINGIPLFFLSAAFVTITWIIYLAGSRISRNLGSFSFIERKGLFQRHSIRNNFLIASLIVIVVSYLYLFCFIVLSQLPLATKIDHNLEHSIPWYFYPMKMGIAGLFGLAFILSYIFKKFEKQVFVFALLIFVSFIIGPYYDEERFAKYFMAGLIGFASLMIYELLIMKVTNGPILKTVLLGVIITSSGLSILAFIGYSSLILQTNDYINTLPRRNFPTNSELHLFEILHNKTDTNSRSQYNIVGLLNEYNRDEDGLISKIASFSGLPYNKIHQSPLSLNTTSLESLYNQLQYTDARYIIVPKDVINNPNMVTKPAFFAIEHFTPIYQDEDYIVLEVPSLKGPSSMSKVALVYDPELDYADGKVSKNILLPYNRKQFDLPETLVDIQNDSNTQLLKLSGARSERGISVWAKNITAAINANQIETGFQITSENVEKSNDVRIEWQEGGRWNYYVKLSIDGLELYETSDAGGKILLKNIDLDKLRWKWYNLKIESLPGSIKIYIDNILKIQALKTPTNDTGGITRLGLTTFYNDVQFSPVRLDTVTSKDTRTTKDKVYDADASYAYNYPISMLALSKLGYDTFGSNDLSVLSKKVILIPDSILSDSDTIGRYLNYAQSGGELVIINSNGSFSSIANKIFSLTSNGSNQESFTHIADNDDSGLFLNISGLVNRTDVASLPDIKVIASYSNDKNEQVAPFIIEKSFPTGGKIIYLNSHGYFNSITNYPRQSFPSLASISEFLSLGIAEPNISLNTALPMKGFGGKMKMSGLVSLNSSSLLFNEGPDEVPVSSSSIMLLNRSTAITSLYSNVTVKDLKIIGDYTANINFKGQSNLPDDSSHQDYIGMRIPSDFNMSIDLSPKSSGYIQIVNHNGTINNSITLSDISKVTLFGIKSQTTFDTVPILVKEPVVDVKGHIEIKNAYLNGFLGGRGNLITGAPVIIDGQLVAKINSVDNFDQPYRNATKTRYITYFEPLIVDGRHDPNTEKVKLPGDIYYNSKDEIPFLKILASPTNVIVLAGLIIAFVLATRYLSKKKIQFRS